MEEHRLITYCRGVAEEFNSRINRVRNFVSNHNLTSGTANESILRDFLSVHSPSNYEVATGFICRLFPRTCGCENCRGKELQWASRQCDILIFDRANYPLVFSEGTIRFVNPSSVRMAIEVKTNLNSKKQVQEAMENISSARQMIPRQDVNGGSSYAGERRAFFIFAFKSLKVETVLKHLKNEPARCSFHNPTGIILFEKEKIILQQMPWKSDSSEVEYDVLDIDKANIITFLYLAFLNSLGYFRDEDYFTILENFVCGQKKIKENVVFGK